MDRYVPTPGFRPSRLEPIRPRPNFLHRIALPRNSIVTEVEAAYCPVCLGRTIRERMRNGQTLWHCEDCGHEW